LQERKLSVKTMANSMKAKRRAREEVAKELEMRKG
jgi:hypothetical protein